MWFLAVLVLAGCGRTAESGDSAPTARATVPALSSSQLVGPSDFAAAIAEPTRVTINVHVPYQGEIPGTVLMIPYDQITKQADRLPADRSVPLAIYCRTGPMSAIAATTLAALGYTNLVELQGGMQAWEASGRTLTRR